MTLETKIEDRSHEKSEILTVFLNDAKFEFKSPVVALSFNF